jgi:alkylation response protein AidB-like acyl-CoA dehydrogenase
MTDPNLSQWARDAYRWLASTLGDADSQPEATDMAVFHDLTEQQETQLLNKIRAYRRARFDAGYGALTLPTEYGGAGLPASYAVVFNQLEQQFPVPPSTELISVTTGLVAPAVALFGTETQRSKFLAALLCTDMLACQLFSEPGAGSDLASLSCRAERDGDHWVISGQKVWTSGARHADLGMLLARNDPTVVKHAGITAFLLPLDLPGVNVRPIRQMTGGSSFNEVFLDNVHVPDELRLGQVGQGWKIATTVLAFERQASGAGTRRKGGSFADLLALARRLDVSADPVVRDQLASVYVLAELHAATARRVARASAAGAPPVPAASIGKLVSSQLLVRIGETATDLLGMRAVAHIDDAFAWTKHVLGAPGYRLAGGTDQIQRNIIAERVLGLPAEPRSDKGIPFF